MFDLRLPEEDKICSPKNMMTDDDSIFVDVEKSLNLCKKHNICEFPMMLINEKVVD